jgi:hypothetical protein
MLTEASAMCCLLRHVSRSNVAIVERIMMIFFLINLLSNELLKLYKHTFGIEISSTA